MPVHDHLEVRITVDGQPLQEYQVPDDEETDGNKIVRYIEATVGQRFEVSVRWLPGFNLMQATNLIHSLHLDDQSLLPDPIERKVLTSQHDKLKYEYSYKYRAANAGQGKTVYYSFGAFETCKIVHFLPCVRTAH